MVKRTHCKAALKGKNNQELRANLVETKKELAKLRNDKSSGSAARLSKIRQVRKNVARILTAMSTNVLEANFDQCTNRKYRTRAIRQRLNY
jgi:large subunit ribosomal protein L35e